MTHWHTLDANKALSIAGSSTAGLTASTVLQRQKEFGKNLLQEKKKKPAWRLFLDQFSDFMILILIVAAIVSGIAGDPADTFIILVIILLNAIVGFIQEYRAEKAMDALKKMASSTAVVIRDGNTKTVAAEELVPGDIVLLEAGNVVPADTRLLESHSLRIDESSLTGESIPIDKTTLPIAAVDIPLGDRSNLSFKGTQITNGRGKGVVVATGMNTELGKIATMLQGEESVTPLQKKMTDFGKKLSFIIIAICIVLFGVGLLRGEKPLEMLLLSISLAVAAIPEALPALITIALAKGARRLVAKNVLIRKLPAVETLGSVTYVCSDKTGTLTQNKMTVVEVSPAVTDIAMFDNLSLLETAMLLNHDAQRNGDGELLGDPTETALIEYFSDATLLEEIAKEYPREAEIPFDSERKCMTTIHGYEDCFIAITKGAAESVSSMLQDTGERQKILNEAEELAAKGVRVLAFSYRLMDQLPDNITVDIVETDMKFAGLVGMIDPPREEITLAITECKTAGIRPVMITGDHIQTASAIARKIGILEKDGLAITGSELAQFSNEEFFEKVERIQVYARVSPQQKLDIVKALQSKNHFVAMTGDGVNDAPSLKAANIGIAMGITGTEVSKEAAHMILLDDNFATIIRAVKEGRRIYDNIRKFIKYIMACNSAEILTIFLAPLIGLPNPLLPIHILWINLITDGLPGLALSAEKAERNIMKRPPRPTNESLFAGGTAFHIMWVGILMAAVTLGAQAWALYENMGHWQTMVFTVLSFSQLGQAMAVRSDVDLIYRRGIFTNRLLAISIGFTVALQLAIIYLPFANRIFKTQPLSLQELLICIALSAIVFHAVEAEKWWKARRKRKK